LDLLPTEEQVQIVDSVVDVLTTEFPRERHRGQGNECTEPDKAAMQKIAELGWYSLGLEPELGGLGYGLPEEALLFTEVGRHLGPMPALGAVLGARVASRGGQEALVGSILAGDTRVGLAVIEDPSMDCHRPMQGQFRVLGARGCDYVVFLGRDSAALLEITPDMALAERGCIDATVSLGNLDLAGAHPTFAVSDNDRALYHQAVILTSAMLVGIGEAARDMAVEYAKVREQFGKPIGAFQAVRHPCAEAAVRVDAARAQLWFAAVCADQDRSDAGFQAAASASLAIDAAHRNCQTNIQVHGAIGGTDEHDAHLLLKRSHLLASLFGDLDMHLSDALAAPLE